MATQKKGSLLEGAVSRRLTEGVHRQKQGLIQAQGMTSYGELSEIKRNPYINRKIDNIL